MQDPDSPPERDPYGILDAHADAKRILHADLYTDADRTAFGVAHLVTVGQSNANRDADPIAFTDDVRALYDRIADPHRNLVARVLADDLSNLERDRDNLTQRLAAVDLRCDAIRQRLAYLTRSRGSERDAKPCSHAHTDNA